MYSIKEFRELFLKDLDRAEALKAAIEFKYKRSYSNMSIEKFLNWYFVDYPTIYFINQYIELDKSRINIDLFKKDMIIINNKRYIKVTIFNNDESNIKTWTLFVGSFKQDFLIKEDAIEIYNKIIKSKKIISVAGFIVKSYPNKDIETTMFKTNDDFYGNYTENGVNYCEGNLYNFNSNLDLWTIRLSGNDNYSISTDYSSKKEAMEQWNILKNLKVISKTDLKFHYFSN